MRQKRVAGFFHIVRARHLSPGIVAPKVWQRVRRIDWLKILGNEISIHAKSDCQLQLLHAAYEFFSRDSYDSLPIFDVSGVERLRSLAMCGSK